MIKKYKTFLNLLHRAFKKYKYQFIILTILGFLSGLLEAIGVNAFIPILSSLAGDSAGEVDFISKTLEQLFIFAGIPFTLIYLLIFVSVLFLMKAIALLIFTYIKIKIRADYEQEMRNDLFGGALKSTWQYILKQRSGHLQAVLITDVANSAKLFANIAEAIMIITALSMYILVAVNISWQITVITIGAGGLIFMFFKPLVYRIRKFSHQTSIVNKKVSEIVNESLIGMKTIKSTVAENEIWERGGKYFDRLRKFQIKLTMLGSLAAVFIQPISIIFISIIFVIFVYFIQDFNIAVLLAVAYLVQRIFAYVQMLQSNYHSVNNLFPYLYETMRYRNSALENQEDTSGTLPFKFNDKLEFQNVKFSYDNRQEVLEDVNFKIEKGKMIGFIGFSGAGKTTLFDLCLRLFKPNSGSITIDGKDISSIRMNDWRGNIGYISQDIFLTNDTIGNNIRFYRDAITDDEINHAAKEAHIYDFIEGLPDGFDTVVGDRGIQLSAGQRQRVAIARVLVKKPPILLLDEATSALDNESEIQVQKVIEKLKGETTILVIAHRLSTVINSDKLFVLENGKIIEKGTPQELLKDKESYFYKVYNIRK